MVIIVIVNRHRQSRQHHQHHQHQHPHHQKHHHNQKKPHPLHSFLNSRPSLSGTARISTCSKGPTSTSHTSRFSSSKSGWTMLKTSPATRITSVLAFCTNDGVMMESVVVSNTVFWSSSREKVWRCWNLAVKKQAEKSLLVATPPMHFVACGWRGTSKIQHGHEEKLPCPSCSLYIDLYWIKLIKLYKTNNIHCHSIQFLDFRGVPFGKPAQAKQNFYP